MYDLFNVKVYFLLLFLVVTLLSSLIMYNVSLLRGYHIMLLRFIWKCFIRTKITQRERVSILMLSSVCLFKIIYTYIYDDFFLKFVLLTVNEMENRLKNFLHIFRSGSSCTSTTIMLSSRQPSQLHVTRSPCPFHGSTQINTINDVPPRLFNLFPLLFFFLRALLVCCV